MPGLSFCKSYHLQLLVELNDNAHLIKSNGTSNKDPHHFDLPSVRIMGKRYAEAYKKLLETELHITKDKGLKNIFESFSKSK